VPQPDAATASGVVDILRRVSGRLRLAAWSLALAMAAAVAALVWLAATLTGSSALVRALAAFIAGGVVLGWRVAMRRDAWTLASAACAIERAAPASRNVIVTAEELLRHPNRARPAVQRRVFADADRVASDLHPNVVVPLTRPLLVAAVALASMTVVLAVPRRAITTVGGGVLSDVGSTSPGGLTIAATITPPAYTGEAPRSVQNPERIEAVEGSRLHLSLRGPGAWRVRAGGSVAGDRVVSGGASVELTLAQSGYLAIEPAGESASDERRLIAVVVNADRAPTIRIEAPGKDLLVPDLKPVVAVSAAATDDYGLASLELKYTRISGSGEQFEFQEGSVPLRISRANDRAWSAESALAVARLGLAPGDSLVYRIVGRDRRPGDAGLASSDTFFIEVAGPGQVALEGFEMPPDRERYALSQQMIVLKLERLRARERSIDRATLEREVAILAAEQRAVRANFIFLTGGTVEDEEEEAEHSHEIQEGRLENSARRELSIAIQHMGRAEQGLAAVSTGAALPPARAAVAALQRAFGRNRYFLRTVPVRSRVDPARRLSGNLADASSWKRELFPAHEDVPATRARVLLARLLELSPEIRRGELPKAALTALAEEALSIDPASGDWQAISRSMIELRDTTASTPRREELVNQAARSIAGILRQTAAGAARSGVAADTLRSAWQDARERK
jgi:hypothetical protein